MNSIARVEKLLRKCFYTPKFNLYDYFKKKKKTCNEKGLIIFWLVV